MQVHEGTGRCFWDWQSYPFAQLARGVIGNTVVFGTIIRGSSPCGPTILKGRRLTPSAAGFFGGTPRTPHSCNVCRSAKLRFHDSPPDCRDLRANHLKGPPTYTVGGRFLWRKWEIQSQTCSFSMRCTARSAGSGGRVVAFPGVRSAQAPLSPPGYPRWPLRGRTAGS